MVPFPQDVFYGESLDFLNDGNVLLHFLAFGCVVTFDFVDNQLGVAI